MHAKSLVEKKLHRIRAKAGIRHPVERAVDATLELPLREALLQLRNLTAGRTPPVPGVARFIRESLRLTGSIGKVYSEKAAWSWAARMAVRRRVSTGREQELVELLEPLDIAQLDSRLGRGCGLILAGAHLGVPGGARRVLVNSFPNFRSFVGEEREEPLPGERVAMRDAHSRRTSLVSSVAFLRQRGVVYAGVDGKHMSMTGEVVLFGRRIPIGRGIAALARLSRAPSIPVAALWTPDCRVRLTFGSPLPEAPQQKADTDQDWEASWLQAWAQWFESLVRNDPHNIRLNGGLWHDSEGGLLR